jgi:hypothetical protein
MRALLWCAAALCALLLLAPASRAEEKDKLQLDKVPKKVMDALKAKFPKAKIHKCTREETSGSAVVYHVEFKVGGRKGKAAITEYSALLNYEEEVAAKDLPAAVKKAVDKRYPKAKLKEIRKIAKIKDKKEILVVYEITLTTADKKDVEVKVDDDGEVLEDSTEKKKD